MRPSNLCFLLPSLTSMLLAQAPIPLATTLCKVRLHPDEAWITRKGSHAFEQGGTYRLVVKNLPPNLRLQDLRVAARGPEGTRLGDVSLKAEPRVITESQAWKSLQEERERVQVRLEELQAEGEGIAQETAFLKQLLAQHREELGARLAYATPKADTVVDLSKGLQERLRLLIARDKGRQRELQRTQEEAARMDAQIRQQGSGRQAGPTLASVELSLPKGGRAELELTYRNGDSRWEPAYEARLSADRSEVELVLFAAVRQRSGEAWEGVALEISSARASRDLRPVKYEGGQSLAWYDQPPQANYRPGSGNASMAACVEVVASESGPSLPRRLPTIAPEPPLVAARELSAATQEELKGLSTLFALEGSQDVPADGEPHRFRILSTQVHPSLALVSTPRLDPTVYQMARFPLPTTLPLYPGAPIVHFAGTQRLGEGPLVMPAPGEAFQLAFGPYQGLRVALRRLDAQRESVGTFSKDRLWTLREGIELGNESPSAHQVEIYDRVLGSSDDRVKVTTLPESTPAALAQPGVRRWVLNLAPGSQASLRLAQQIRGPQEGYIAGLEGLRLP